MRTQTERTRCGRRGKTVSNLARRAAIAVVATSSITASAVAGIDADLLSGLAPRSIGPAGMSGRIAAIDGGASRIPTSSTSAPPPAASGSRRTAGSPGGRSSTTSRSPRSARSRSTAGTRRSSGSAPARATCATRASVGNGVYRSLDGGRTLDAPRPRRQRAHPPHRPAPRRPRRRLGGGARPRVGREPGARRLQDDRRRQDLAARSSTSTSAPAAPTSRSTRRNPNKLFAVDVAVPALAVLLPLRRSGLRPLRHLRRRRRAGRRSQEEDGLPEGELGRIGVAICRSHPEVVYALVEAEKSALLRSDDGGRSFKTVNDEPERQAAPVLLRRHPRRPRSDPNRVYSLDYAVRVSTTAARASTHARRGWDEIHGDHHAMWIDPREPAPPDRRQRRRRRGEPRPRPDLPLRRQPAARPVLPRRRRRRTCRTTSTAACRTTARGAARRRCGSTAASATTTGRWSAAATASTSLPDPADSQQGYAMWQGGNLHALGPATRASAQDIKPPPPAGVKLRFNWNAGARDRPVRPGDDLPRQPVRPPLDRPRRDLDDDLPRPDHRTTRSGRSRTRAAA